MDLITGGELAAIEARLEELDHNGPLPPEIRQLLVDANTLVEQVHEMRIRWTRVQTAMIGGTG
jgi:hypothetical protein